MQSDVILFQKFGFPGLITKSQTIKGKSFFSVLGSANKRDDRLYEKPKDSSTSKDNTVVEKLQKKLSLKNYFMDLFQLRL